MSFGALDVLKGFNGAPVWISLLCYEHTCFSNKVAHGVKLRFSIISFTFGHT
jgi:hypothetical protein